ncbi:MAG: hypothetical protein OIF47_13605 [Marinibacterium sp.]|nr:hypothetical protein [Marinibacterium sp.]
MDEIEALQSRLLAAMERIGSGTAAVTTRAGDAARETGALRQSLEEETLANAQLQERLSTLKTRHAEDLAAAQEAAAPDADAGDPALIEQLRDDLAAQAEATAALDASLQQLRAANDALRQSNAALRQANADGVGDAALINAALQADLDALTAARAAETAEIGALLARVEPMLNGAAAPQAESEGD